MSTNEFVCAIISEVFAIPRSRIFHDQRLVDIAQDSIQLFELLMRMERELGRSIQYEEIAHIETVGDIIATLNTLNIQFAPQAIPAASF